MRRGSKAEVKPRGWLGVRSGRPRRPSALSKSTVHCAVAIAAHMVLLTLEKFSRLKRLNASIISSAPAFSVKRTRRDSRVSNVQKSGPRPRLRPAKTGRSVVL